MSTMDAAPPSLDVRRAETADSSACRHARPLGISVSGANAHVQRGRALRTLLLDCRHIALDGRGGITEYEARRGCERCRKAT